MITAAEAVRILAEKSAKTVALEELVNDFYTAWGHTLSFHNRTTAFAAFALFLEQRGMANLSDPEEVSGVTSGDVTPRGGLLRAARWMGEAVKSRKRTTAGVAGGEKKQEEDEHEKF